MGTIMTMDVVEWFGRIFISSLYIFSAVRKLRAPRATRDQIAEARLPMPNFGYVVTVAVDVLGAASLILGFWVREAAVMLVFFTFVLAFKFHGDVADRNQSNHFMKNFAIIGGLLVLIVHGPGQISLDAWLSR